MNDWFNAEHHVEKAHEHFEAGRWDEAESELRQALELNPYRAEWHFNLGLTLEAAGRWEDSIDALSKANELDGDDEQTLLLLGLNSLRIERYPDAIEWLERAERLSPTRPDSFVHRIEAYARLGRHDDAEAMFYQSLHCEGEHAAAYANIAESLIDRGLFERAVFCLREASALDPNLPRVHARLACAYQETGRTERARQLYLKELRANPGDVETLLDLGCLLLDMNRLAESGEKFRRVLEIEPNHADAHFFLGELAARLQRHREAQASYTLVLRVDPEYPGVRRRLASLKLDQKLDDEARKLLRREMREFRRAPATFTPDDLDEFADLLLDANMPREAARVLRQLKEHNAVDPGVWHRLSLASFQTGNRSQGVLAARRVIKIKPTFVPALHNLALACIQERQFARAAAYLRQAMAIEPDDPGLRRLRLMLRMQWAVWQIKRLGTKALHGNREAGKVDGPFFHAKTLNDDADYAESLDEPSKA